MTSVATSNGRLVLASTSPRRKDLLEALGLQFEIVPSLIEEIIDPAMEPQRLVLGLAKQKTEEVFNRLTAVACVNRLLVLGADTIVVLDGRYLGKPQDKEEARQMLTKLSGRCHDVFTGVVLMVMELDGSISETESCEKSKVYFRKLAPEEIYAYVETSEPMDKAGAYALQGIGAALVEKIDGSHTNIVGLPIPNVVSLLRERGYAILGLP